MYRALAAKQGSLVSRHGKKSSSSGEEDVERAVPGGRADGARVHAGLVAHAAQAQVPARQQQHARSAAATRLARQLGHGRAVGVRGRRLAEATRPRVLGLGLADADGRTAGPQLVQRGAEARGDGLVAPGHAHPRLALGARLAGLLLELRVAVERALQACLRRAQPPRRSAAHGGQQRAAVPPPRLLQRRAHPLRLHNIYHSPQIRRHHRTTMRPTPIYRLSLTTKPIPVKSLIQAVPRV
uniref:Uncharacterized protein n=1 Tax=Zea mays TaxID=4577 RepID=A0A804RIL7_MAIZE